MVMTCREDVSNFADLVHHPVTIQRSIRCCGERCPLWLDRNSTALATANNSTAANGTAARDRALVETLLTQQAGGGNTGRLPKEAYTTARAPGGLGAGRSQRRKHLTKHPLLAPPAVI